MLNFYARDFLGGMGSLQELKRELSCLHPTQVVSLSDLKDFAKDLAVLESHLRGMVLPSSIAQVERIAYAFQDTKRPVRSLELTHLLKDLQHRIDDELRHRVFYCVEPGHIARFFRAEGTVVERTMRLKPLTEVFGERVMTTLFPNDEHDVGEAIMCIVCGRYTAAVFHLMRMLEIGLTPFAELFGVSMAHTNWGPALEKIESHIKQMHREPPWKDLPDCKDRQEAYSQAASHFDMLRIAWRNYTAHARGKYTNDEADNVFQNVKGFLNKTVDTLARYPAPTTF